MYCLSLNPTTVDALPMDGSGSLADLIGGKAANLARVAAIGVDVPVTRVVVTRAVRDTLADTDVPARLDEYRRGLSQRTSAETEEVFRDLSERARTMEIPRRIETEIADAVSSLLRDAPHGLAVRSSAAYEDSIDASFAGVFESHLGIADVPGALEAIVRCWISGWSPRALRYLQRMNVEPRWDAMGVILQPVLPARSSGVLYTADPDTGNPWRFVARATHGLSVDLMSGSGAGDSFELDWRTGTVLRRTVSEKNVRWIARDRGICEERPPADLVSAPAAAEAELAELVSVGRLLDEGFDQRLDIEWVFCGDRVHIVQARPLTALPEFFPVRDGAMDLDKTWQPAWFSLPLRAEHAAGFLTPFYRDYSESEMWYRYQPDDIVLTGIWREECDAHGYRYTVLEKAPVFTDYFAGPAEYEAWLDVHERAYRERWDRRHEDLRVRRAAAERAVRESSKHSSVASAAELVPAVLEFRDALWDWNSFGWSGPQALGWMCEGLLDHFGKSIDPSFEYGSMVAGGSDSQSFRVARAIQEVGRSIDEEVVRAAFSEVPLGEILSHLRAVAPGCEFLDRFEVLCWEIGRTPPSFGNRPAFWQLAPPVETLHSIKRAAFGDGSDAEELQRSAREARVKQETQWRTRFCGDAGAELEARFDKLLRWARYWTQALNDRHGLGVELVWEKEMIWELGQRLVRAGVVQRPEDVLLFYREDLESFAYDGDAAALSRVFEDRAWEYRGNRRLSPPARIGRPPDVLDTPSEEQSVAGGSSDAMQDAETSSEGFASDRRDMSKEPPGETLPADACDASTLDSRVDVTGAKQPSGTSYQGEGLAGGEATGRARRVEDLMAPGLLDSLTAEDILVLPHPDAFPYADWHSLLTLVKGVLSPGRLAHHLSQVARECGVPVVGHVGGDLGCIPDGARIRLDARSGRVTVLDT